MAINTITLLELVASLAEANGDYLPFDTTTDITTDNEIISTTLNQYDDGEPGAFDSWWVYITEGNNIGKERRTGLPAASATYATTTGALTVAGAALVAESAAVTCELFRYKRDHYKKAIIEACKEIYPSLFVEIDDQTLITGNILPDGHFESWSSSTALNWWTETTATLARTTTAANKRGGTYSVEVTTTGANGNISLSSNDYPRLLELQGKTVDAYVWAYPDTLDDPTIIIDTVSNDGTTTQTLTSTTSCPLNYWTEIKLESQTLNDDLQEVKITFNVASSGGICYFDDAYLGSQRLSEYLLPDDLLSGHVSKSFIQTGGHLDPPCYDLRPFLTHMSREFKPEVISDGTYRYLRTPGYLSNKYRMRLLGMKPLETLSSDTNTITLDSEKVPLLIAKAQVIFYEREVLPISVGDKDIFEYERAKARNKYRELLGTHGMFSKSELIK